jgi:hypothetical protein
MFNEPGVEHVGWLAVTVAATGIAGAASMTVGAEKYIQPFSCRAVIVYVPAASPAKVADAWKLVPSIL